MPSIIPTTRTICLCCREEVTVRGSFQGVQSNEIREWMYQNLAAAGAQESQWVLPLHLLTTGSLPVICINCENGNLCSRCNFPNQFLTGGLCATCRNTEQEERSSPEQYQVWSPKPEDDKPFVPSAIITSQRYVGLENETHRCPNMNALRALTLKGVSCWGAVKDDKEKYAAWGAKHDGSIEGMEFISPPLRGLYLQEQVHLFCTFARQNKWQVVDQHKKPNGLHVHLDMRKETWKHVLAAYYALVLFQPLLRNFIPKSRSHGPVGDDTGRTWFCQTNNVTVTREICVATTPHAADMGYQLARQVCNNTYSGGRYTAINICSYGNHKTIEVRMHHGSLVEEKIVSWVVLLQSITDWACDLGDWKEVESILIQELNKNLPPSWTTVSEKNIHSFSHDEACFPLWKILNHIAPLPALVHDYLAERGGEFKPTKLTLPKWEELKEYRHACKEADKDLEEQRALKKEKDHEFAKKIIKKVRRIPTRTLEEAGDDQ